MPGPINAFSSIRQFIHSQGNHASSRLRLLVGAVRNRSVSEPVLVRVTRSPETARYHRSTSSLSHVVIRPTIPDKSPGAITIVSEKLDRGQTALLEQAANLRDLNTLRAMAGTKPTNAAATAYLKAREALNTLPMEQWRERIAQLDAKLDNAPVARRLLYTAVSQKLAAAFQQQRFHQEWQGSIQSLPINQADGSVNLIKEGLKRDLLEAHARTLASHAQQIRVLQNLVGQYAMC